MPTGVCSLHPSLRDGLAADLGHWRHRSITQHAMHASLKAVPRAESDVTASFGIYNNTLFWLSPDAFTVPRNPHIYAVADDLRVLLTVHGVPDVEFILNVDE